MANSYELSLKFGVHANIITDLVKYCDFPSQNVGQVRPHHLHFGVEPSRVPGMKQQCVFTLNNGREIYLIDHLDYIPYCKEMMLQFPKESKVYIPLKPFMNSRAMRKVFDFPPLIDNYPLQEHELQGAQWVLQKYEKIFWNKNPHLSMDIQLRMLGIADFLCFDEAYYTLLRRIGNSFATSPGDFLAIFHAILVNSADADFEDEEEMALDSPMDIEYNESDDADDSEFGYYGDLFYFDDYIPQDEDYEMSDV